MSATTTEAPQALYRFFDEAGGLLYIGISVNPLGRWDQHRTKTWWREVRSTTVEMFDSREAVEAAELAAIEAEEPRYNVHRRPMVMRSIRVPLKLWTAARELCDEREENISDVVREALERYVRAGRKG